MINHKSMQTIRLFIIIFIFCPNPVYVFATDVEDSLYRNLGNAETNHERVKAYFDLSKHYMISEDTAVIKNTLSDFYIVDKLDDSSEILSLIQLIEEAHVQTDTILNILNFLTEATNYFKDCDCDSLKAEVYYELGYLSYYQVNYYQAQNYFVKALEYAEAIGSKRMLLKVYTFIGHLYTTIGNYDAAEEAFKNTYQYYTDELSKRNKIQIHYSLGRIYLFKGRYKDARSQLLKALELSIDINYHGAAVAIYSEFGHVEYADREYEKALEYFYKLEEIISTVKDESEISIDYFTVYGFVDIGKTYYRMGDYDNAIFWLTKARTLAIENKQYLLLSMSAKYLERIYEEKQKFKLALDYFKEYQHISDSLLNARNITQINRLEIDYLHLKELTEKKLKRQALEIEFQKSVKFYQTLTISGVSALLIVLLLFYIFRLKESENARIAIEDANRLKAEKEKLQSELDYKNRELTTSVMYLLKKNNLVWNLSEKLKKAILPLAHEAKKPLQDIIKEADANIGNDSWDDFETRFNNVHQDFSNHLLKDYPDLTPNELKLSAFIRLNMSTKEISTITYQSHNSITVARHRLRAKLGVEREENLVSFLSKY